MASKDSNKKHVTAYRHMTKCRLRWRIAQTFPVSKRRTMLSRMATPAAFLCTETPRSLRTHVLFSILRVYRRSLNLRGISWARELREHERVNKVADKQGEAIIRAFRVGTITPNVSHPILCPCRSGQDPSAQAFGLLIIVRSNQTCGLLEPMRLATFAWASTTRGSRCNAAM